MKPVFYNGLAVILLSVTVCLSLFLTVLAGDPSYPTLAWLIGCTLFLLDASCRVRLYWVDPIPHDKVLSFLSETGGGQFLCLPLWLWGCAIIAEVLLQPSLQVLFAITLILADIVYRLRNASLATRSSVAALVGGSGMLPPLWILAGILLVFAIWRSENLADSGWPSAKQMAVGILVSYVGIRFVYRQNAASPSSHETQPVSQWHHMRQHLPWRQLTLGALIPMLIFYVLSRLEQPVLGAVLAGSWGLGVVLVAYWRCRRIDLFAGLAMVMAVTELLVIAITRNPDFYLASEAIQSTVYGLLCLGSLVLSRSLIQRLAEATGATARIPDHLRQSQFYRTAWHRLSTIWGGVYLLKASGLLIAQWGLPLEAFLVIRSLSGFPVLAGLLAFSFWFPGWYWRRHRTANDSVAP